ncbi:MAG: pilus assembly protein PilM [Planctomycetota bacterium]|nr:pilus assembly protein PilM [Planctomycetota bacterium]MDI6787437.1 pilus assembly protein PilM [Planctomycetota bacterium]
MKSAWGFDISKSSLKAVRLRLVEDIIEVVDFDVIEYPATASRDEDTFNQDFRAAYNTFRGRHKIRGDVIVVSPPFHQVFNRFVSVPPAKGERLQEIIKYEAQQHLPFAIEEVLWSYQKIERSYKAGEEIEAVFFAVKRDLIDGFIKLLTSNSIKVDIIQFAPVALYNYIMADYSVVSGGKNLILLDIGTNNTNLILIEKDKFWIRNLPIVGNDITKAIQQKLEIPFEEAERLKINTTSKESPEAAKIYGATQNILKDLASEIHRSIGFYKSTASGRSVTFDKIILMGNASKTIYFEEFVSQRLQIATVRLSTLNRLTVSDNVNRIEFLNKLQGLGVATGLALQGLETASNKINLLPPEIIQLRTAARRKPFIAAIAVLVILIPLLLHLSARDTLNQLTDANQQVQEVLDNKKKIAKNYEKIKDISDQTQRLSSLSGIGHKRDVFLQVLNSINKLSVFANPSVAPLKGYIETGSDEDDQYLREEELKKIWLLEIKMSRFITAEKPGVPKKDVISLEMVCGLVAKQKRDGEFDPVASHSFVKTHLVRPLLELLAEFNISETDSSVDMIDAKPISELKTNAEIKQLPFEEEEPKYYRAQVKIQIPIYGGTVKIR